MPKPFKTCLLIDDNPLDNYLNSIILNDANFAEKIVITESSKEALSLLKTGTVKPDVIFLDIRMPEMDGFQFLDEYDKLDIEKDHIKFFILSSSGDPVEIAKSKANKYVTALIKKGQPWETLSEVIHNITHQL